RRTARASENGQLDHEPRAPAGRALHEASATMSRHDVAYDRKADACTGDTRSVPREAMEAFEDALPVAGGNPRTLVLHRDARSIVRARDRQAHLLLRPPILDGIVKEVQQHLAQGTGIDAGVDPFLDVEIEADLGAAE